MHMSHPDALSQPGTGPASTSFAASGAPGQGYGGGFDNPHPDEQAFMNAMLGGGSNGES